MRRRHSHTRGFSLSELLVVMAIIAALAAIALPLFLDQYHAWQKRADEQIARDACAAATQAYLYDPDRSNNDTSVTYYYNEATGEVSTSRDGITSYGRYDGEADYDVSGVTVTGNAAQEGVVSVAFGRSGTIAAVAWGKATAGPGFDYGIDVETGWWSHSDARQNSFNTLMTVDNESRKKHDIAVLQALADYFEGMDAEEARKILGETRWNKIVNSHSHDQLFQYAQDGAGSIRIAGMDTDYVPYFEAIGYNPRLYTTQGTWRITDSYTTGYNYVDRYLFTSNEMIGTAYKQTTGRGVRIKFDVADGKLANVHIWVNDFADQGFEAYGS